MTELKTLKDLHISAGPFEDSDVDEFKKVLKQEAIKWIKELGKENLEYEGWEKDDIKRKNFLQKFGFTIDYDDEYSWTQKIINTLTNFIKYFFNITEEDLKCK